MTFVRLKKRAKAVFEIVHIPTRYLWGREIPEDPERKPSAIQNGKF